MKKKAKVDWKKVWSDFRWLSDKANVSYAILDYYDRKHLRQAIESQLSHKPKKVKGRKK